jgi:DNA-binding Xre family transcriptional regulator
MSYVVSEIVSYKQKERDVMIELSKECIESALRISGCSKYRLAKESGIALRTIQRWFNTDLKINSETLDKLCVIMDVEPAYLQAPYSYIEEVDGTPVTFRSYHYDNTLTDEEIHSLSAEERKRVDPNRVYVAHFSEEQRIWRSMISKNWDLSKLMREYIITFIQQDRIEGVPCKTIDPNIVLQITGDVREATDKAIEDSVKAIIAKNGNEDK